MVVEFRLYDPQAVSLANEVAEILSRQGLQCEVCAEDRATFDRGELGSVQEAFELLRVVLVPGGIALILRAIAKIYEAKAAALPKVKIEIDNSSIELSGNMKPDERNAIVAAFLGRVDSHEPGPAVLRSDRGRQPLP